MKFASVVIFFLLTMLTVVSGQDPSYLKDFPGPEEVRSKINGQTDQETYAMRNAVFWRLQYLVDELAGKRQFAEGLTNDEQALKLSYKKAAEEIWNYCEENFTGVKYSEWRKIVLGFEHRLENRIINELIRKGARDLLLVGRNEKMIKRTASKKEDSANAIIADSLERQQKAVARKRENKVILLKIIFLVCLFGGGIMLVSAFRLRHKLSRYEFENMSDGGVVQFRSYEDSLKHHRKKVLIGYIITGATILLLIGVLGFLNG